MTLPVVMNTSFPITEQPQAGAPLPNAEPQASDRRRFSARQRLGTLVYDWPQFLCGLRPSRGSIPWVHVRNRNDRLIPDPDRGGVCCGWENTRTLHLCDVFPFAGRLLLQRALTDWPVRLAERSNATKTRPESDTPAVTFIICHRGLERLPLLQQTLRSIAGQEGVGVECLVVEQDAEPLVRDRLPEWVRYTFDRLDGPLPFNRSRAFNKGAALARGNLLILHDGDTVVPAAYAEEHCRAAGDSFEVVNLKRFVFYLARPCGVDGHPDDDLLRGRTAVESVVENHTAGVSVAIRRAAFDALGGMDEGFWGWGGEDVEFWNRCRTRRVWNSGHLPLIHLWHAPQAGKTPAKDTPAMRRLASILSVPAQDRIRALRLGAGIESNGVRTG